MDAKRSGYWLGLMVGFLFLAVLVGIIQLWAHAMSPSLAQAAESLNQNNSLSFTQQFKIESINPGLLIDSSTAKFYFAGTCRRLESINDDGTLHGALVIDTNNRKIMKLDFEHKIAHQWELEEEEAKDQSPDPSSIMADIRSQIDHGAKLLGEEQVMGRSAKAYQLKATATEIKKFPDGYTQKIWIDSQTRLEIKSEVDYFDPGRKFQCVDENFKWNEQLDSKLFSFDVPPGFSIVQGKPER